MYIQKIIDNSILEAFEFLFKQKPNHIELQQTKKEFEGDVTLVVFPLIRSSKKGPEETAEEIGNYLKNAVSEVDGFNVVKGFLNLSISSDFWLNQFIEAYKIEDFGITKVDAGSGSIENTIEVPLIPATSRGLKFHTAAQELNLISDEFFKLRNHNPEFKNKIKEIKDENKA